MKNNTNKQDLSVRRASSLRNSVARRRRYGRIGDARRGERTRDIVADRRPGRGRTGGFTSYSNANLRVRRSTRERDNRARRRRDERRGEMLSDSVENRSWEMEILGDFLHYPNAFISIHNYDCALVPSGASMQGEETTIWYGGMWMKFYRSS